MKTKQASGKIHMVMDAATGKIEKISDDEGTRLMKVETGEPSAKFIDAYSITVVRTNPCIWIYVGGVWYRKCW